MWGYKTQLEDLKETVSTIQKVLLDADNRRELSNSEQHYIEKLKEALYDADDLFDEVRTLAELKQLRPRSKRGKLFEKVRCFFSSNNQLGQAYRMSRDVKDIKKRLEGIAECHNKFGFSVDYKPIIRRREETCSYVDAKEIIGREQDKEAVLNMLLDHNAADEDFSCVTIVGVGGLGKTTLAQLVYNDEKVQKEFELRAWACVSDQEGAQFDVKTILCKILESVIDEKFDGSSTMQLVQNQVQERLRGKKYLIVLDDVWNEEREKWLNLKKLLMFGQGSSRIVVTTRSERTGAIIGEKNLYPLLGLSPEKSWHLFEMSAFKQRHEHENHNEFIKIGKKIVENCHSVPLALKVVGSLLFDQDISKWRSFENSGLVNIGKGENQILSILKLSYHNLALSLKSCFSYCAVFPKGRGLEKGMLINLWMAQGYITPLDGGQSLADAGEEHFVILLRRCFFQDVERDDYGYVKSVKIHDLMHDVAQEVGREEIQVVTTTRTKNLGDKVRHVNFIGDISLEHPSWSSKIRTFISPRRQANVMVKQIENWKYLRVLVLYPLVNLPDLIGELLHLRYLDVSYSHNLTVLPDSITRLHNLQTLVLSGCFSIKELPKDFCKLVKLRHLDLSDNWSLSCMPPDMQKLTSLKVLSKFVVGKKVSSEEEQIPDDELKPLLALTGIRGKIMIEIGKYYRKVVESTEAMGGGGYLKGMEHLTILYITFHDENGGCDNPEAALETLEPPSNIKDLVIRYYNGTVIPKWGRAVDNWAINLSHLAQIRLSGCRNLQEMPVLSKLRSLKKLVLGELEKLEYMETSSDSRASESEVIFFPSLVYLAISYLKRLKGWWKGVDDDAHRFNTTLMFPCLSHLQIHNCPDLTSFPPCPSVEVLELTSNNEALQIVVRAADKEDDNVATAKLRDLTTDNLSHLKSLPINCLTSLRIYGDEEMDRISKFDKAETLESLTEEFQRCASSLQFLWFWEMKNVRRLIGGSGLAHFTALETLHIIAVIPRFCIMEGEDEDGDNCCLFWKSFPQNLRKLEFYHLREETSLPKGMQYLTSLQTLHLSNCKKLEAIPDWIDCLSSLQSLSIDDCEGIKSIPASMRNLTSLQRLEIEDCPDLRRRCEEPDGEDRPKIRHIPHIELK